MPKTFTKDDLRKAPRHTLDSVARNLGLNPVGYNAPELRDAIARRLQARKER